MTTKNTVTASYGAVDDYGENYRTGKNMRCIVNGQEILHLTDFKYETGVDEFMKVTITFLVSEMEINRL